MGGIAMDPHRPLRVSEAIREELSEIIGYEMSDPRIAMVDVTEVLMSPDRRQARVRLHLGGDEKSRSESLLALEGARQFLRRELASKRVIGTIGRCSVAGTKFGVPSTSCNNWSIRRRSAASEPTSAGKML